MRDNTAASIILAFLQRRLQTSLCRPLKVLVLPTWSLLLCFLLSETLPGFKEYICKTQRTRGELKNSLPNRETGKVFILCPGLLTFESSMAKGRCLKEAKPKELRLLCLNDMEDWILNKAGSSGHWHQSCHSICIYIPEYLVKQVSFLFSWLIPSLPETKSWEDFKYQRSDNKIEARVKMHMFYWQLQPKVGLKLASIWKPRSVSMGRPSLNPYSSVDPAAFHIPLWPSLSPTAENTKMSKRSETCSAAMSAKPQMQGTGLYDVWHVPNEERDWKLLEKIRKWYEGLFSAVASLWSRFKKRWVVTGCFYIQCIWIYCFWAYFCLPPVKCPKTLNAKTLKELKKGNFRRRAR